MKRILPLVFLVCFACSWCPENGCDDGAIGDNSNLQLLFKTNYYSEFSAADLDSLLLIRTNTDGTTDTIPFDTLDSRWEVELQAEEGSANPAYKILSTSPYSAIIFDDICVECTDVQLRCCRYRDCTVKNFTINGSPKTIADLPYRIYK